MSHVEAKLVLVFFGCVSMSVPIESARILAIETAGGRSHWNFMSSISSSLMKSGHDLTVFAPYADMDGCDVNCTLINTSENNPFEMRNVHLSAALDTFSPIAPFMRLSVHFTRSKCNAMYGNSDIERILKAGNGSSGYDVLLIEPMAGECASRVATVLQIPVVYVVPSTMVTFAEHLFFGHVPNPAVVPHVMNRRSVLGTFAQRLANFVLSAYSLAAREYHEQLIKYTEPEFYDSIGSTKPSLVFVNSHHIAERSRPLPPNCIPIGGIHLGQPKDLPEVSN